VRAAVLFRIRQQYKTLKKPDTGPSFVVVSLVTVVLILVLPAAGNIMGLLMLMIEKFFHGDTFKNWPYGNSR
jgi:hypothetical protein